ncbi:MAG: 4-(cytidine 5'-diphospho)-2-C-methyl-D-erythritol kinase [Firmicutes bacterium]|nr:4-(cytidine 5'-diphospho)-2-C-methyl-D-erythritol kinase [Bacillota bacterium]
MDSLEIKAPAKINWGLEIVGKREDGYHLLRSLMQTVDLCDVLRLTLAERDECRCSPPLPDDSPNLALQAWQALKAELGLTQCLLIEVEKKIPVAAGLGGGSADAAAVLRGADRLLELGLDMDRLSMIGMKIGADVPFCLHGGLALVEGAGERVTPLAAACEYDLVLVDPAIPVSTAKVYAAFDKAPEAAPGHIDALTRAVLSGDKSEIRRHSVNMLEPPAFRLYRRLREIQEACADTSACAHLSGSGGVVWALCPNRQMAQMTARAMAIRLHSGACTVVRTADRLPE